jgi:malic enzyme
MKTTKTQFKDLNKEQKEKIKNKLEQTYNMQDFLFSLNTQFDLKNAKVSELTKKILSNSMITIVLPLINPNYEND